MAMSVAYRPSLKTMFIGKAETDAWRVPIGMSPAYAPDGVGLEMSFGFDARLRFDSEEDCMRCIEILFCSTSGCPRVQRTVQDHAPTRNEGGSWKRI